MRWSFLIEMMIVLPVIVWMMDDQIVTQTVPNKQKLQMKMSVEMVVLSKIQVSICRCCVWCKTERLSLVLNWRMIMCLRHLMSVKLMSKGVRIIVWSMERLWIQVLPRIFITKTLLTFSKSTTPGTKWFFIANLIVKFKTAWTKKPKHKISLVEPPVLGIITTRRPFLNPVSLRTIVKKKLKFS